MNPETVFQAVLGAWPELSDLLGPEWPAVRDKVRVALERLRSAPDAEEWFAPAAELVMIFMDQPRAHARLQAAIGEASRLRGPALRGPTEPPVAEARQPSSRSLFARLRRLARGRPDEPAPLTRYTDISCPREVS